MKRRDFIVVLAGAAAGSLAAAPAAAQRPDKQWRLGVLAPSASSLEFTQVVTLPELAKLGFSEGQNLVVDARVGDAATMHKPAEDLVLAKPDAIIVIGNEAAQAVHEASATVPIVLFGSNLVGLAASFAHPGGNVTGVVILGAELDGKRLDLLREALPAAHRIAALMFAGSADRQASEAALRAVASRKGLELLVFDVSAPEEYPSAFAAMHAAGAEALVIMAHPQFYRDGHTLAALAGDAKLATVCEWAEMARVGCMLGYGPDRAALRRRLADYVARIFRGETPAEMPIETPTRFEFAVNLKTARALGLEISPNLLARIDEVVE